MMDFLRKHMRIIFIITIVVFIGGAFVGFGGYFFGGGAAGDAVAEVNGNKISYRKYTSTLNALIENLRNNKEDVTNEVMNQKKREVLQDLIQKEVFWMESKKYGITVSDGELAADLQHYPAFQREGRFDKRVYIQIVYQMLHTTPSEFEESRRRDIAIYKLRHLIASSVKISEPELRLEYSRVNKGKMSNFEKDRAKFLEKLREEKIMMVFNEWFRLLNQTVKIKVHLQDIEKQS